MNKMDDELNNTTDSPLAIHFKFYLAEKKWGIQYCSLMRTSSLISAKGSPVRTSIRIPFPSVWARALKSSFLISAEISAVRTASTALGPKRALP